MGTVYLAEDRTLGRKIALKVLSTSLASDDASERQFRQEARTVANLDHPHIVRIHAFDRIEGAWTIEMPYIETGSLADAMRLGRIPPHQAVGYAVQALEALACCHEAGVVHRDVKPGNILLPQADYALLSDFGLAELLVDKHAELIASRSSSCFFVGTPLYSPPESWDGEEAAAPTRDVYAAGMVLFEAVAAQSPYDARTPFALMRQLIDHPLPPLADVCGDVSSELSEAVSRMTARNPADRPYNAREALALLKDVPEAELGASVDVPTVAHRIRSPRRNRARDSLKTMGKLRWVMARVFIPVCAVAFLIACLSFVRPTSLFGMALVDDPIESAIGGQWLFDTVSSNSQEMLPSHGIIRFEDNGRKFELLASERTDLWSISGAVQKDSGHLLLSGHWAEYADETARVFRYGTISGNGTWLPGKDCLAMSLRFRCVQDGSQNSRSFTLFRAQKPRKVSEFVGDLASRGFVGRILYQELEPRKLAWVQSVEGCLEDLGVPRNAFQTQAECEMGSGEKAPAQKAGNAL